MLAPARTLSGADGLKHLSVATPDQPLKLDSGRTLDHVEIAYETWGTLNADKSNVVVVCHALTMDQFAASPNPVTNRPAWWPNVIGPGKAIDTDRFFVICSNILGGCMGSTGPSSRRPDGTHWGTDFPVITIADMVRAQIALLDKLGIQDVFLAIGGSIGGMQVLEWTIQARNRVFAAIPIAVAPRQSAQNIGFYEVGRQAIMADPNWQHGDYYHGSNRPDLGLAVARMVGHVTYLSDEAMRRKFGRRLQDKSDFSFGFDADFQVESYLRHQGSKFVRRFDANSLLYITRAADYFDMTQYPDPAENDPCNTKYLVISYSSDWLYPTYQAKELVRRLKRNGRDVSFCEIEADCGHDAFLIPDERLTNLIRGFLHGVART